MDMCERFSRLAFISVILPLAPCRLVGVVVKGPGVAEDEAGAATKLAEKQRRRRTRRSSKLRSASSNVNVKGKALAVTALVLVKIPS